MSLYVKVNNSVLAGSGVDGRWYASQHVDAPEGYFVVSGSWWYDTTVHAQASVTPSEDAHRNFSAGTENLPIQYEVELGADAPGTLYVYAVCRELP